MKEKEGRYRTSKEDRKAISGLLKGKQRGIMGIYAFFYTDGTCAYVGKADCLVLRLLTHVKKRPVVHHFEVYPIENELENRTYEETKAWLRYKEAAFIAALDPAENVQRPKIGLRMLQDFPIRVQHLVIRELPDLGRTPAEEARSMTTCHIVEGMSI